jgi:hypothetical protein
MLTIIKKSRQPLAWLTAALIPAAILATAIGSGEASFLLFSDAQDQTYAWLQTMARAWHQGYLMLWDSHIYSGRSFVGEIQTSALYPLVWLWLALFSTEDGISRWAIEGLIVVHFSIASVSMFGLLRHWRLGSWASLFGAICFASFGSLAERAAAQPNILFGLTWLPLAVLLTSMHLEHRRLAYAAAAGAVIGLQVLAGHAQPAFHTALLCGALCIFTHLRNHQDNRRQAALATLRSGLTMVTAALIIAAPQLWLTAEYMGDAYRWVGGNAPIGPGGSVPRKVFLHEHVIAPAQLLGVFDGWLYRAGDGNTLHIGTLAALLALWIGFSRHQPGISPLLDRHGTALKVITVFAIMAMLGHWTPLADILRKLPLAGHIRQLGRYSILFHFAGCTLAAIGLQRLCSRDFRAPQPARRVALAGVIGALFGLTFTAGLLSSQALIAALLALFVLVVVTAPSVPRWAVGPAAVVCTLVSVLMYRPLSAPNIDGRRLPEQAYAPVALLAGVESEFGRSRILFDASAGLPNNYASTRPLQTRGGYSATMYRPYFDFLELDWSLDSEVNDLLNVRYVLSGKPLELPLVGEDSERGLRLYRRPSAYPRIFLASQFRDPDLTARQVESFQLLEYTEMSLRFRITLAQDDQVVISELDYPGWCACAGDRPVKVERAQLAEIKTPLRSLRLPAGTHDVRMEYRPFAGLPGAGGCE